MSRSASKLSEEIIQYIKDNPIIESQRGRYNDVAIRFGKTAEQIRRIHRTMKEKGEVIGDTTANYMHVEGTPISQSTVTTSDSGQTSTYQFRENTKTGDADLITITNKRIKTLEDLIEICEIDLETWSIISWECNKWEVGAKNAAKEIVVSPLFQVKAKLARKTVENDLNLQKQAVIAQLKAYSPIVKVPVNYACKTAPYLLEICIHDLHLGSLAWGPEAGEDYDLKIAESRLKSSVRALLSRVDLFKVERILFPVGNDLFNIDNKNNSTVNGTVVDTDVRFIKMVKAARKIIIETIDELSLIAPVDVVIVQGNHDFTISLVFGEILDAFYANNQRVTVNNAPSPRKYYKYGSVGIQLTHGDQEPHQALGLIFATEEKELWASTKFRFCQLGHFHKNKKISFVSVDEHQGFQVQILPTLSSSTAWAHAKGYSSLKQAKAFLFHKEDGLHGEFTYTV